MWNNNQMCVISYAFIMLFHITCKCLERKKTKAFLAVVTAIAVIAAVTGTVLLAVGSVLSIQNG